ncbi:MAG TPA: antibiotic biosynthesis monooxygenase [Gemmatimonadales bacterium]|nr:antibiotic biosynthesis monooxygenase [Gemmatimonadales bacterium]
MHVIRRSALVLAVFRLSAGAAMAQDPVPIYPDNYKVMIENDRVRVMDFRLRKGGHEDFHAHPAHVLYVLEPFRISFKFPDGRTGIREVKAGEVLFSDAVVHSPTNIGETDAHGILIELKTPDVSAEDVLTAVTFIQGREGKGSEVKRELLSLSALTRAEPGNLRYDLYQSVDRPDRFMRLEVWQDEEALELHKATPHLKASFERRKNDGWATEITRWRRVPEELGARRSALK